MQSEPQREALDQLLVLGTLLEGHADHVMDAVGPVVVPSVATIRSRFDERRHRKQPPLQRLLRALLGIDAKLSQYTRGKAFVDHVVDRVGMAAVQHRLDQSGHPAAADRDRIPATMDRPGAVAELRAAVAAFAKQFLATADGWCVALSGGPDSLALTGVAAPMLPTTALIVDHGLQPDSAAVAADRPRTGDDLGCVDAQVLCVQVAAVAAARRPPLATPATPRWTPPVERPGAAGAHPRRPGRDGAARIWAAARVRGRSPGCAARPAVVPAAAGGAARA